MIPVIRYRPEDGLTERLKNRSQLDDENVRGTVKQILARVREEGDRAVFEYTQMFDGFALSEDTVRVSREEIDQAYAAVDQQLLGAMRRAAQNIREFHEKQLRQSFFDMKTDRFTGMLLRPIGRVGVYAPGGRAAYPSSVLMDVIPASVAGVDKIVMTSPPDKQGGLLPLTVVAAVEAGVHEIYKVGGAQAIGALAFGTQTIPRVDKIVGPGNVYVANAKREVYGIVGIDMIAGPSEVLIVADDGANPRYIAADMLSQAEHDPLATAILVTDSEQLARRVQSEVERQLALLLRKEIAEESIERYGTIAVADSILDAIDFANLVAPEHLELAVRDPMALLGRVKNAGAVFLGGYSPEPLGDYFAGPNHVLPTSGTARFFSPLNVDDFIKKTSVISYSREALEACREDIAAFARAEGLEAHARAVEVRFEEDA